MKKLWSYLVLIFTILVAIPASGMETPFSPGKGDFAIYEGKNTDRSSFTRKKMIEAIDQVRDLFDIADYSISADGPEKLLGRAQVLGKSLRKNYIQNISDECILRSGTLEKIQVLAGEFLTCKVSSSVGSQFIVSEWLGENVPFGIVKQVLLKAHNPDFIRVIELSKFTYGQE